MYCRKCLLSNKTVHEVTSCTDPSHKFKYKTLPNFISIVDNMFIAQYRKHYSRQYNIDIKSWREQYIRWCEIYDVFRYCHNSQLTLIEAYFMNSYFDGVSPKNAALVRVHSIESTFGCNMN